MTGMGVGIFGIFFLFIVVITLAPLVMGVYSIGSILTTPEPAFGPWWDNTRMTWLIGVLVSFVIPLGGVIAGIMWISTGRRGVRQHGVAGRPPWAGSPKPPPYYPAPGPYPPQGPGPGLGTPPAY